MIGLYLLIDCLLFIAYYFHWFEDIDFDKGDDSFRNAGFAKTNLRPIKPLETDVIRSVN